VIILNQPVPEIEASQERLGGRRSNGLAAFRPEGIYPQRHPQIVERALAEFEHRSEGGSIWSEAQTHPASNPRGLARKAAGEALTEIGRSYNVSYPTISLALLNSVGEYNFIARTFRRAFIYDVHK